MKLAILLPRHTDLGWLWRGRALALAFHQAGAALGRELEVVIGLPHSVNDWHSAAQELREGAPWITPRGLEWSPMLAAQFHRAYAETKKIDFVEYYNIPRDGGWNFGDCDAWIVCGDERTGAVAPLRPTAVYCRDLSSRYVVGEFGDIHRDSVWSLQTDAFLAWRQAACVFAVESDTIADVVSFVGAPKTRTLQTPSLWGLRTAACFTHPPALRSGYIAWLVEPNKAHDILTALSAVGEYVIRGGKRWIALVGEGVAAFDLRGGESTPIRQALAGNIDLLSRMRLVPVHNAEALNRAVADAAVIWSSRIADGEPDAPLLAAQYGKWLLAADFPQMRSLSAHDQSVLYDPFRSDALLDALFEVDRCASEASPSPQTTSPFVTIAYETILTTLASDGR